MTYPAPTFDFDDGLVHSHNWASNTPPGSAHNDRTTRHTTPHTTHEKPEIPNT